MIDKQLKDTISLFSVFARVVDPFVADDLVEFFKHQTVGFGIPAFFGRDWVSLRTDDGTNGGRGGGDVLD